METVNTSAHAILADLKREGIVNEQIIEQAIVRIGSRRRSTLVNSITSPVRTTTQTLSDTFATSSVNRLWIARASPEAASYVKQIEYEMEDTPAIDSDRKRINYLMKQIRDGTNNELKTNAVSIFKNDPPETYEEFTKLLLKKKYVEPIEIVGQHIASCNMYATDYIDLLNELTSLTQGKVSRDELIKAISEKIPSSIARQLAQSISTLKAADQHLNAETALKLANNFRQNADESYKRKNADESQKRKNADESYKQASKRMYRPESEEKPNEASNTSNTSNKSSTLQQSGANKKKNRNRWLCKEHRVRKDAPAEKCENPGRCTYQVMQKKLMNNANSSSSA